MLQNSIGILSALAFVLGLVWVAVWIAKRYGALPSGPRTRVAIEIVQRVSVGPKTGLAVVRVGEKVMAVSMGPDGMRPLFELDEVDRQRILASSQVATPMVSSAAAELGVAAAINQHAVGQGQRVVTNVLPDAIAGLLPPKIVQMFQRQTVGFPAAFAAPASFAESMKSALNMQPGAEATLPQSMSASDREFRNVLSMTLSTATRIAVFGGVAVLSVLSASRTLSAQTAPPSSVVTTPVTTPVTTQATQPAANPSATAPVAPTVPDVTLPTPPAIKAPAFIVPPGASKNRPAAVRPAATRGPAPIATAQTSGQSNRTPAQVAADQKSADSIRASASAKAPTSMLAGSASRAPNRQGNVSPTAPTARVGSGDEALANMLPQMDLKMGDGKDGGLRLSGTVGIVVMMGLLTLVPTLLLMMTGFTRILIVLHFLKQAMGTQSAPPTQLLAAMALLLTGFVMAPTFTEVNRTALEPWMDGKITQVEMLKEGVKPMRVFMMKQTREPDLRTFMDLSRLPRPNTIEDVPLHILTSAFVASELRRAFQIGFIIYLPFIIIDAVVASVLMSMGMFMLPPAMISMPFKLLLFVLVDGWGLIITELVKSFK